MSVVELYGNQHLISTPSLEPVCSWLWWIPWSIAGMIITPPPFICITKRTHPWILGKSDVHTERPIHTFMDDCAQPSTIIAFSGITGSNHGDIVWATPTVWNTSLQLFMTSPRFYNPFVFLKATLTTSAQRSAAQPLLIICWVSITWSDSDPDYSL